MLSGCPELKAQISTLSQFWKLKKTPCANGVISKKAPCPAAHPQYSQVWVTTPPPPGSVQWQLISQRCNKHERYASNTKHSYNIYRPSAKRLVLMLHKCFVFAGYGEGSHVFSLSHFIYPPPSLTSFLPLLKAAAKT